MSSTTTTHAFKPSLQLQTKTTSSRAFASSLPDSGVADVSEARYWAEKFGLGKAQGSKPQFAHPRSLTLKSGSSAIVHQLQFDAMGGKFATLAVVCGPRVQLYGTTSQSTFHRTLASHSDNRDAEIIADRLVQTGGQLGLTAAYRNDGRLLAVGTDRGQIRIADVTSRATLCTFETPTKLAVRSTTWFRDGQHLLAAGDDGVLRVWQLAQGALSFNKPTVTCLGHGDAIRTSVLWQYASQNRKWPYTALAMTGSYDHTVRIWKMDGLDDEQLDTRCLSILSHGGPVECLLLLPSSNPNVPVWLLSAGGTTINVWNPLNGVRVSSVQAQHRKTITSLLSIPRRNSEEGTVSMRVLTGALDGLLRIHSWDSSTGAIALLHGIKLDVAISALASNDDADRIAIGTTVGTVLVKQMGPSLVQHKRKREPRAGTYAFFTRGMNADVTAGDFVVDSGTKKRKLQSYDVALRQFRYGDALDEALESRIPQTVVAVLEELGKRRGLTIALSNRDEESLEPILSFTVRYITRPRFAALLIGVSNKLVDIYGDVSGQSETIDELFAKLKSQVVAESRAQRKLLRVVGQLDAILTSIATKSNV
jgi:U3 small nucleolar RNA-associated protein 15